MASIFGRVFSMLGMKKAEPRETPEEKQRREAEEQKRVEEELKKQKLEELKTKVYRIDRAVTDVLDAKKINLRSDLDEIKAVIVEINIILEANKETLATAAGMASSEDSAAILKKIELTIPNLREESRLLFNYANFVSEEIDKYSATSLEKIHSAIINLIFTWYGLNHNNLYRWWNSKS